MLFPAPQSLAPRRRHAQGPEARECHDGQPSQSSVGGPRTATTGSARLQVIAVQLWSLTQIAPRQVQCSSKRLFQDRLEVLMMQVTSFSLASLSALGCPASIVSTYCVDRCFSEALKFFLVLLCQTPVFPWFGSCSQHEGFQKARAPYMGPKPWNLPDKDPQTDPNFSQTRLERPDHR